MQSKHIVAKYYRQPDGSAPVSDYIDALTDEDVQEKIVRVVRLVHDLCTTDHPHLPLPHARPIEGPIYELRAQHGKDRYRILYAISHRMVILLHIFRKGGDDTPEADKTIARARWEDFNARMNASPRQPPSPLATGFAP